MNVNHHFAIGKSPVLLLAGACMVTGTMILFSLIISDARVMSALVLVTLILGMLERRTYCRQPERIRWQGDCWLIHHGGEWIRVRLTPQYQITPLFAQLRFREIEPRRGRGCFRLTVTPDSCSNEEWQRLRYIVRNYAAS